MEIKSITTIVKSTKRLSTDYPFDKYKMTANPRGLALIIEIDHYNEQQASENIDVENLKIMLKHLRFKIQYYNNLDRLGFHQVIRSFASNSLHQDADMMIFAIINNGTENGIITFDGGEILLEDIFKRFNNQNCPNLKGKPKFFIIQSCRGNETDEVLETQYNPDSVRALYVDQNMATNFVNWQTYVVKP